MEDGRIFYIEIDGVEFKNLLTINDYKFISSTGTRSLMFIYTPMYTSKYNVKLNRGTQAVIDYIDKSSRYFKYLNGEKYVVYIRETIAVLTELESDTGEKIEKKEGTYIKNEDNTFISHSEEHFYYKVKAYDVSIPLPDFLGGDINLWKTEEYEFYEKKVIKDNTVRKIKLSEYRKDYQELVFLTIDAIQRKGKSLQQSLEEAITSPFASLGNISTLVGGLIAFWSKSKNPYITIAGTVTSFVGLATLAAVCVISKVPIESLVLEYPQSKTYGGVYRNHFTNKESLNRTPDWGTKE